MSSATVMAPTLPRFAVVPMQPEHYVEAVGTGYPWLDAEQAAFAFLQCGPAFAAVVDGRLAAVGGVAMESPGVGLAWAILTDTGRAHPMFIHRQVARHLRQIIVDYRLRRVTARCVRNFYAARRWVHTLGFTKEGTMRRAAPGGGDFTVYALFPGGGSSSIDSSSETSGASLPNASRAHRSGSPSSNRKNSASSSSSMPSMNGSLA